MVDPENLQFVAMLFSLQRRAEDGNANWLKLAPAMDALVYALVKHGWGMPMTVNRPEYTIEFAEIDLDGEVIAIQRQNRTVAVLDQVKEGMMKAQPFHPPCARTIETIIGFNYNADESGKLPYYGAAWDCALDVAASNGQSDDRALRQWLRELAA